MWLNWVGEGRDLVLKQNMLCTHLKYTFGYSAFIIIQICTNFLFFFFFWQDELIIDKLTSAQTHSRSQNCVFQVLFSSGASGRASARPSSASQCVFMGSIHEPGVPVQKCSMCPSGCSRISSLFFPPIRTLWTCQFCYFSIRPASLILV